MTKPETSTQAEIDVVPGVPLEQFEAAIEAFKTLREQGRFAIFQGRGDSIRLIGEPEELVISLQRMSGIERMDLAKAKSALEEIRTLIQVSMVWNEDSQVLSLLESNVFDDHFTTAKKNPSAVEKLRQVLRRKLELAKTLVSPAMLERAKRLSTSVGAVLEDVDVELINQRNSHLDQVVIASPFLRLKLRYSERAFSRGSLFFAPPWLPATSEGRAFELECDETDIDLLVGRLLKAKELLSGAVERSVSPQEDPKTTK